MSKESAPGDNASAGGSAVFARNAFRFRFPAAIAALVVVFSLMGGGWSNVEAFSLKVASLGDEKPEKVQPQIFDPRSDIWFDPGDSALKAFGDLEDRFVGEDFVFLALRDDKDPMGVFGTGTLETIARLTKRIETIPYVRNVRSLTMNPWIRWGQAGPDEEGLLVSDLFEDDPSTYSEQQRLERMVAILGAARTAKLVGEERVRKALPADAKFSDHIGEPRLINGVVSEDARTTAIQIQILRPRATDEKLDEVFGSGPSGPREVGPVIYKAMVHSDVVAQLEQIVRDEKSTQLYITGVPVLEKHFQEVGQGDMKYVGMMFGIIALMLLIIYRRASGVVTPLLVVFATIMGMNGAIWITGELLNNLTGMAPTMMTGVAIADAVHLMTAYFILRPAHSDKASLIMDVLKRNALPVFLTSVTTAVGFYSLTVSVIVPVKALGYAAGTGTIFAYLLTMTVIPALLSLIPLKNTDAAAKAVAKVDNLDEPHWSDGLVRRVLAQRAPLMALTVVLAGMSVVGLSRMEFGTDMRVMFREGDIVRRDVTWIGENLGGTADLELVFHSSDKREDSARLNARQERIAELEVRRLGPDQPPLSAAEKAELAKLRVEEKQYVQLRIGSSAEFLEQLDGFQRQVLEEAKDPKSPLRIINRMDSALDVLRKMHQVQNENKAAFYRVPQESDVPDSARSPRVNYDEILEETMYIPAQNADSLVAQYYLQYENGAKPSENLESLVTPDRRGFRMTTRLDIADSSVMLAAFERIRVILRTDYPQLVGTQADVDGGKALSTMEMTGKQYMFTNMFQRFSDTLVTSLSLALACITLLIGFVFRSPTIALLSLIPNVLPIVLPLAMLGLLGIAIDGPSVVVATVALGICVDDSIHFLTKFTKARREGYGMEESLRRAFRQVGAALTWTTIVLMLGFSALTMGTFRPNIVIGYLGTTMIGLAWVADFVLLPAVLSYLDRDAAPATPNANVQPATETA